MNRTNKILLLLVVVLLVVLGGVLLWQKGGFERPYSAVYLSTGDIYFGKLSHFPRLSLTDVWLLQRSDDQQNPYGISKFSNAFWGPEDRITFDSKSIVWFAELKADSELVKFFKNPQQVGAQQTPSQRVATTTLK